MNKITLIGNLTKDPEIRSTSNGNSVAVFSIAVNRKKTGEPVTDFFRINAWGKLGENCAKYLGKGKKVAVIGELQYNSYQAKGETKHSLDVLAEEIEFLTPQGKKKEPDGFTDVNTDDLPF